MDSGNNVPLMGVLISLYLEFCGLFSLIEDVYSMPNELTHLSVRSVLISWNCKPKELKHCAFFAPTGVHHTSTRSCNPCRYLSENRMVKT